MLQQSKKRASRSRNAFEVLEARQLLAAHIVGSSTSYATIQAAINAAASGATINVDAGTYTELITVSKPFTIRGAKAGVDARSRSTSGETIVSGTSGSSGVNRAFYISANDVTLDGFTVQGETNQST